MSGVEWSEVKWWSGVERSGVLSSVVKCSVE